MFPSIKNKVLTQGKSRTKIKKSSSILISSKRKESCIKACIPYIEQLRLSSIKCSPQKYSLIQKRNRIHTEINSRNMDSSQNIQYIPEQINYDENVLTVPSQTQVKRKLSKNRAQLKLQSLLKQFQKMKHINDEENKTLLLQKSRSSKKYEQCVNQFQNLPKNKLIWTEQVIQPFFNALISINPFFKKLKPIVSLCLLKIGHIKVFQQNQLIQKENDQMTMIGIILWGEALLKNCQNKMKIYLFPGDSINEELIFPNNKEMLREYFSPKGGFHSAKQSGKTKTQTGILYLKLNEYKMIFQQLVKIGQKNSILLAENMMKWSFAKKKNTRKQFSHI